MSETTEYEKAQADEHKWRQSATKLSLFTKEGINSEWVLCMKNAEYYKNKAKAIKKADDEATP